MSARLKISASPMWKEDHDSDVEMGNLPVLSQAQNEPIRRGVQSWILMLFPPKHAGALVAGPFPRGSNSPKETRDLYRTCPQNVALV